MTNKVSSNSATLKDTPPSLLATVSCPAGSYCELFSASASLRPHWQPLIEALDQKGEATLESDHERARRMRHEDGATINPFDDLTEQTTSWALDMIPFPVSAQEWSGVESGLKQRAGLLEKILADTYGAQDLLKNGRIDSELFFANPNFLHSCHGIQPSENRYLTFYAADIYRDPNGQFRVLRDYGGNPAGLGYALENRIVMSRLFSKLYHKTQIRRLAPFFNTFHRALIKRASLRKDDPGIVLFSPGPDSHIYFEHALLSRYLGYPLVEGQDLTVRNGKVFLKKLAGLEPVEAIIRHIDDINSDPFALRRETASGVAGLIQVCREQNIDIVNPIGSGFVDTPALKVFLPQLCRDLLGEELLLPNHPTWWCGNREGLEHTLNNLGQLSISSAMEQHSSIDCSGDLHATIQKAPSRYVAVEPVSPSSAPAWSSRGVSSCYNVFRVFVCATEGGYAVMPGGLAIIAGDSNTVVSGSPEQQGSKDVWVLSDKPVEPFSLMGDLNIIPEFKRSSDLPNRVADNLLWLGRYLERAEGLIRLLRAVYRRLSGEDRPEDVPELQFILSILQTKHVIPTPTGADGEGAPYQDLFSHLHKALYRKDRAESVISILQRVQQTARNVRDRLSVDSTRVINRLEDFRESSDNDPLELLDQTLFTLSSFSGLAMESMTRGLGWRFMDMGRRMERAMNQAVLMRISLPLICADSQNTLLALLEVSDSLMTYRGRYRSSFQLAPVLDLLLADESNPKSLAFQFYQLEAHVESLPQQDERRFSSREERVALEMLTAVRLLDLTGIRCGEENPETNSLTAFLTETEAQLKEFAQQVTAHYLTRVPATPHYSMIPGNVPV
ncbi:circularly permuted type 2 ATP-grasp protein [Desulfopila sp. IMCC35008]|uniref:circularly permuted type 2 ATP-grasp protein n=1 Tax=Desulfopila sp. IMCC35008 TaxID=2653858 RepID=UPI0013D1BD83|nr:circularly permuted type 2 ATP-grasp protein [Desulfopila sp. IMCC35008]